MRVCVYYVHRKEAFVCVRARARAWQAGEAGYLPRSIRARVFRIVRELFNSIGTLVSVRGESRLLPGLKVMVCRLILVI